MRELNNDGVQVLTGASESAAALPEVKGWHTNISTSTGRLYYINGLTGWSTYDTPTVTAADDLRQAGWESFLSSDTGCRYFHCLETGECTYDVPACPYDEEDILEDGLFDRGTRQFPPEEEQLCCAADASASFDPNGDSFEVGQRVACRSGGAWTTGFVASVEPLFVTAAQPQHEGFVWERVAQQAWEDPSQAQVSPAARRRWYQSLGRVVAAGGNGHTPKDVSTSQTQTDAMKKQRRVGG